MSTIDIELSDYFEDSNDRIYLFSNTLGEHIFSSSGGDLRRGMQQSNRMDIYGALSSYISHEDWSRFENVLCGNFFYRQTGWASQSTCFPARIKEGSVDWEVRPIIEDLFIQDISLFHSLVSKLIEKDDERFYNAFTKSLQGTDLDARALFSWDLSLRRTIHAELEKLQQYGHAQTNEKQVQAVLLAEKLLKKISLKPIEPVSTLKSQFENLKFKLDLLKTLHAADATFNVHKGWKRFLVNFITILFSLGILNGLKYLFTGNGFFCNRTTSQKQIDRVHVALGIDNQCKIQYRKTLHSEISENSNLNDDIVNIITQYV